MVGLFDQEDSQPVLDLLLIVLCFIFATTSIISGAFKSYLVTLLGFIFSLVFAGMFFALRNGAGN